MEATVYRDWRGWRFKVLQSADGKRFKVGYQKAHFQGEHGWKPKRGPYFTWTDDFDEAQGQLDEWARERRLEEEQA